MPRSTAARWVLALALASGSARAEEEVTIYAARSSQRRGTRDATVASGTIGEDELARAGSNAGDALRTQPGVEIAASGGPADFTTALVRGASSAELPLYVAGVRINDDLTGSADLSTIPSFLLRRIEVYRGNAPIDADRFGIGGAIFFDPKVPRAPSLGGAATGGSFGYWALSVAGGDGGKDASSLVALRREDVTNDYPYRDDRGTRITGGGETVRRRNADSHTTDAWAIGRVEAEGARWVVVLNGFDREQGTPGLGLDPALRVRTRTERALAAVRGTIACGSSCSLEIGTSALRSMIVTRDPLAETLAGNASIVGERVEPSVRFRLAPSHVVQLAAAADASRDTLALAPRATFARRDFARIASDAEVSPSEVLSFAVLAGVEATATRSDATSTSMAPFVGRVSARAGDDRLALLANAGRYVRAPTLGELYGQSWAITGNADLAPERGETIDVGVRAKRHFDLASRPSIVELDAFAFVREAADLVVYERNSAATIKPFNVGAARIAGVELALSASLASRLRIDEALTLQDPRDTTPGRSAANDLIPYRSRAFSTSTVTFLGGDLVGLLRFDLGARLSYVAPRFADPTGLVVIPAQTTLDLDATATRAFGDVRATLRARAANVTDAARFDLVGYPLPGRAFYVTGEIDWGS